ncbi:MAG: SIR2 family protein [Acidimicrobiia bacterium]|nr:MAG: SIR2 family protein [Acidimicrobiia bacterium]
MAIAPTTALAFSMQAQPGTYAVLVGSGISSAAGIPTGWDMTLSLIRRLATAAGTDLVESDDAEAWYQERYGRAPDFSEILREVGPSRDDRRAILSRYLEHADSGDPFEPTAAHRAIARLARSGHVRVILTTNFDRLIEMALADEGIQPRVIASDADAVGSEPLHRMQSVVVKIHGDYQVPDGMRVTEEELQEYGPGMSRILKAIVEEYGLVVCGWSGAWDPALRSGIGAATSRRYPTYWALRGEPDEDAQAMIASRSATVVEIPDADRFFEDLARQVDALERVARPHPLDLLASINLAKRLVVDPSGQVELRDLILGEARRARAALFDVAQYPVQASSNAIPNEELRDRASRVEGEVSKSAHLLAVAARWGSTEEHRRVLRDTLALLGDTEALSGTSLLISMRSYGGLVVLYVGGIAALAGDNWDNLHAVCMAEVPTPTDGRLPAVAALGPWAAMRGHSPRPGEHDGGFLRENPREYTPVSNRLFEVARPHLHGMVEDHDYERLFDRFEYLLGAMTVDHRLALGSGMVRGPVGRFQWKHDYMFDPTDHPENWMRRQIGIEPIGAEEEEEEGPADGWLGLEAGLFGGDADRAAAAVRAYRVNQLSQINWH